MATVTVNGVAVTVSDPNNITVVVSGVGPVAGVPPNMKVEANGQAGTVTFSVSH